MDATTRTPRRREIGPFAMMLLTVGVGIVAGVGAVAFRWLIALFHNFFFLGQLSAVYDANQHTPAGPWGAGIILAPVLGAMGVAFLVKTFAPEARGHGVPEVADAIYYNKGIIRPVVALVKAVASALSIGSGGSVGREGPIIQIGSAFGSSVGQLLRVPAWQRVTLIAAGTGGGIAATFNTPIGGILFAAEIMLHEVSVRTLVPVAISTATATYVGRLILGANPSFVVPGFQTTYFHITNPEVLLGYVGLGLLLGPAAALVIRAIYRAEDLFETRVRGGYYVRHGLGMLMVGVLIWLTRLMSGEYHIQGVGYATVQDILTGSSYSIGFLLLLFVLKLTATSLTLGSGGSGGIFSPTLFLGATLGGAWGALLNMIFPGLHASPPAFAVAGMAGMVGGTTGAAIAAIVMIFEMTQDYNVIVPMTVTVALAYGGRKLLLNESIYTLKLVRRGHYVPEALQTNLHYMMLARDLQRREVVILPAGTPLADFVARLPADLDARLPCYLVAEKGQLAGFVAPETALRAAARGSPAATVGSIADAGFALVGPSTTLFELVTRMRAEGVTRLLVAPSVAKAMASDVTGWISREDIADSMGDALDLFAD